MTAKDSIDPEAFIGQLRLKLRDVEGVDADLCGILDEHIFVLNPNEDAVDNALSGIEQLAIKRTEKARVEQNETDTDQ